MVQYIKTVIYFFLINFFLAIFYNAFIKSKMEFIFIYIFESPNHSFILTLLLFLTSYLPVVIINGFVIWFLGYLLEIDGKIRWAVFPFYIILFCIMDSAILYIINDAAFWRSRGSLTPALFVIGVNSLALFALFVKQKPVISIEENQSQTTES